jgi:hypothetical protein
MGRQMRIDKEESVVGQFQADSTDIVSTDERIPDRVDSHGAFVA